MPPLRLRLVLVIIGFILVFSVPNYERFHVLYKHQIMNASFHQWNQLPPFGFINMNHVVTTNMTHHERPEQKFDDSNINNVSHPPPSQEPIEDEHSQASSLFRNHNNKPQSSAIFYNIYINASQPENGIRIIQEQTRQIFQYFTNNATTDDETPVLYYNLIGTNYTQRFCPDNVTCTLLNFYEQAHEEVTLQSVHDYCTANPHNFVYYLHNKGSLTATGYREQQRRSNTDMVMSPTSRALLLEHPYHCNVVGVTWEPYPYWHFDGNFWLAKCNYVRKLLPPQVFQTIRSNIFRRLLHPNHKLPASPFYCLAAFLFATRHHWRTIEEVPRRIQQAVGAGRYSNERWISSHPDVVPCDTLDSAFRTTASDFTSQTRQIQGKRGMRYKYEWFRMHGRLYEFYQLYGRIPSNTSFFWKFYNGTEITYLPVSCQGQVRNQSAYQIRHEVQRL